MGDENTNEEIGVSVELTPTGFTAKIKSRFASGLDRFLGTTFNSKSLAVEAQNAEAKAISDAKIKLIKAVGDLGVERLKHDPGFADRAIDSFLPTIIRRQENKEAVLELALEDLRQNPPSEQQATAGDDKLDDAFLNRFERYAEDASEEVLRAKWAKVLASEIRKPGTFSTKVLRTVDELDAPTAELFEAFCRNRLGGVVIRCLSGKLSFADETRLVSSGLLVDPGIGGQQRTFTEKVDEGGTALWLTSVEIAVVGIAKDTPIPKGELVPIKKLPDGVGVPVYVLTDVGTAISSIIPDSQEQALAAYMTKLETFLAPADVREYRLNEHGELVVRNIWRHDATSGPLPSDGTV